MLKNLIHTVSKFNLFFIPCPSVCKMLVNNFCLELISKGLYVSLPVFVSSTTSKKCTKSKMNVQSCCFANLNVVLL